MTTRHRHVNRATYRVALAVAFAMASAIAASEVAGPPSVQAVNAAGIILQPGVTVTINVYGGRDTAGNPLGDYQNIYTFTDVSSGGYRFNYQFTDPHRFHGTMGVAAEDVRGAVNTRVYYGMGDITAKGWTSWIRVSDATFASFKAGKPAPIQFDGPDNPRTIQKIGEDNLTVLVNERPVALRALRGRSPDGGTFWILDDPAFPIMLQGTYRWRWITTTINDARLARQGIAEQLTRSGEATTHAILFVFDSADPAGDWQSVLDGVAAYLRANPAVRLEIQGHTDNFGTTPYNLSLSQKRAEAVKAYLVGRGISAARLVPKGYGATQPVAGNATPEGRALNRRVVFRVL